MKISSGGVALRHLKSVRMDAEFAVVGGGLAGTCSAIASARAGLKTVLIQDRPLLGGNASSEVRLWVLGATAHMRSSNRWAREGGVVNELMMENLWRNPEGNPLIFDSILLEKAAVEENLTVLLNTACFEVQKELSHPDRIASVRAFCSQNSTLYDIQAPLFCDASGDGVVGFLAGAAFRMGAESKAEFNEGFAPSGEFGHLLGHSIYFYTKKGDRPVKFIPPSFALTDIENKIPRYRSFNTSEHGCHLWWIEWGGRLDTVHETETIKWELWRIVYGIWDYIKNSGKFPEAENMTLEWVGSIPGKRESRRFEGDYILRQQDITERRAHADAVAFGGWSIDLHPADGVFAEIAGSHHLHPKGIYPIPYRCYYSRNVENLFLAGRIISASHVAFGSTRVMATCAIGGEAVAEAAVLCREFGVQPHELGRPDRMKLLQCRLLRSGHFIPGVTVADPDDLAAAATITASSWLKLAQLPPDGRALPLQKTIAQMIPLPAGPIPRLSFLADVTSDTRLEIELRTTSDPLHHAPDVTLDCQCLALEKGIGREIVLDFETLMPRPGYAYIIFRQNTEVSLRTSNLRVTGLLRLHFGYHTDRRSVGGEAYDVYMPERRPGGENLAFTTTPAIDLFRPENVQNGWQRPTWQPNAWVAGSHRHEDSALHLSWAESKTISEVHLYFDGDYDHSLETVLMGHPERAVIFGVKRYQLLDEQGRVIVEKDDCHQSRVIHRFATPLNTSRLTVHLLETWGALPAIFEVRCYS